MSHNLVIVTRFQDQSFVSVGVKECVVSELLRHDSGQEHQLPQKYLVLLNKMSLKVCPTYKRPTNPN